MIKTLRLCVLSVALFGLAGCASQNLQSTDEGDGYRHYVSVEQMHQTYKVSLDSVMQQIPEQTQGQEYFLPWQIKKLVYPHTYFGKLQPDNQMISLSSDGHTNGLWIMLIDPGNPWLEDRNVTMSVVREEHLLMVRVRPDLITDEWIGIFLMHELSHGLENMYDVNIQSHESEYFAYLIEMLTYQLVKNESFYPVLDSVSEEFEIQTTEQFFELYANDREQVLSMLERINEKMAAGETASRAETEMRYGFFMMSMVIYLGWQNQFTWEEGAAAVNKMLEVGNMYN